MRPHLERVPSWGVELLRFTVVVAGAGIGLELGRRSPNPDESILGLFNPPTLGVVVGAGLGYSMGGVLARTAVSAISRSERALDGLTPDQVVAGSLGAMLSTLLASLVAWPILLFEPKLVTVPLFTFLLLAALLLGFRTGQRRRAAVIGMFGSRTGLAARPPAASALTQVLDSSIAIDGRILEVVRAGFLHGRMLVPASVLGELQGLADSGDDQRRGRGRRGLSILETLRAEQGVELEMTGDEAPGVAEVDAKLVRTCLDRGAALLTVDNNLARTASLAGVRVLDLHQLALAMRPAVSVGDVLNVTPTRRGREPGQAVAHLEDGTMVVVEGGAMRVGKRTQVRVTSVIATAGGRMVFTVVSDAGPHDGGEQVGR